MKDIKTRVSPFSLLHPFNPAMSAANTPVEPAIWFTFQDDRLLIEQTPEGNIAVCTAPPVNYGLSPVFSQYSGSYNGTQVYVAESLESSTLSGNMRFSKLRPLFGIIDRETFSLIGRAIQIIQWNRDHQYCGRCGTRMIIRTTELAKSCPACSFISFPRLSPAVIMSIVHENKILLARSPHFAEGMYSTLAGFVEPGETLEETVAREIKEEVNVDICDISYIASQQWPFPHSLMIGFTTRYAGGNIRIDNDEIEDAQWFSVDNLPLLPTPMSIARHLIELFIQKAA